LIFVTVGAQMPFDRLVGWADQWAEAAGRDDLLAQIGPTRFQPRFLQVLPFMDPASFRRRVEQADAVVAHAGMGTIITVLEVGRPLLVVPRLGSLGETRNDHQVTTARRLEQEGLVQAAYDRESFFARLSGLERGPRPPPIARRASQSLLDRLRSFVTAAGS
jgi:UDP-N-acetylglucosamine transferase subunit ALG13